MKTENKQAPLALRQVWDWKAEVWQDLKDVPFREAAATIARRAREAARDLGFRTVASPAKALRVAEDRIEYGRKATEES